MSGTNYPGSPRVPLLALWRTALALKPGSVRRTHIEPPSRI